MTDAGPVARPDGGARHRCGYVAIVGRPNVGKSTLLNRLVGQKLSITSHRAQTTRHRILGVLTRADAQLLILDSPGLQGAPSGAMNRMLNRTARQVAEDADVIVMVCDAGGWTDADEALARQFPADAAVLLAVNKVDRIADKSRLLPLLARAGTARSFAEVVPVSARTGYQVDRLADLCAARLPEGEAAFEPDALTDRSTRFLAGEVIREKLFRLLGDELPYACTVEIEQYEESPKLHRIHAAILVERDAHKGIVVGAGGERIKRIASEARADLERMTGARVFLEVFVKVRSGWADTEQSLRAFGYE